jgi:hypothetical protein
VLIAGFLLLVASCVLTPTAAYALDCSAQQQIFTVADPSGFTSLGGQARIRRAENVIESSCSQDWNINTVNFQFSITTRAYYEVGIYEFSDGSQGDNPPHAMQIFTEYTVGSYVDFKTWPGRCYPLYADDDQKSEVSNRHWLWGLTLERQSGLSRWQRISIDRDPEFDRVLRRSFAR